MSAVIQHARISTQDLPASDYIPAVRDLLGRDTMGIDLRPTDGDVRSLEHFRYDADIRLLGTQAAYMHSEHTPIHMRRTAALMSDGLDDIFLTATRSPSGGSIVRHAQGEIAVPSGGIVLLSKARAHEGLIPWSATTCGVQVPRAAIARLLPGLEEAPLRILTPGAPGADSAALAMSYAALLGGQDALAGPALTIAVAHLHELIARATCTPQAAGLPPDGAAQQAPRLALIQQSIGARLGQQGLDLDSIARLHHTTPRQVQRLFASQGTCFSDYLAEARMQHARNLLASSAHSHRRVIDIALDCGFDNLSAFGRAFRRRFGTTPGDARQAG